MHDAPIAVGILRSVCFARNIDTSASAAWVNSVRAECTTA